MRKSIIVIGLVLLLLMSVSLVSAKGEQISKNKVYIDTEYVYVSAEPHTLTKSGYVNFTILTKEYSGDIDLYWGFNKLSGKVRHVEQWDTKNEPNGSFNSINREKFKQKNFCYEKNHLWYSSENMPITSGKEITVRAWIDIKWLTSGKYDLIVKPSHLSFNQANRTGYLYHLDPWWDNNYLYRDTITLTGNTSGAQTNYQMCLNISYDSNMQSDFDDLRFANETHQIDAWLESKVDSSYALVYVEFPTTPANGATQDYYMYYGNSVAVSDWNGSATFQFYDDGEGKTNMASITTGGWTVASGICQYRSTVPNMILFISGATCSAWQNYTNPSINGSGILEFDMLDQSTGEEAISYGNQSNTEIIKVGYYSGFSTIYRFVDYGSGYMPLLGIPTRTAGMHYFKIDVADDGSANIWINGKKSSVTVPAGTLNDAGRISFSSNTTPGTVYDRIRIRSSVSNPPTYILCNQSSRWVRWNSSTGISNVITTEGIVQATINYTSPTGWKAKGYLADCSLIMGTDYHNSTGSFTITDGILDEITVYNLTTGDLIILYEDQIPVTTARAIADSATFIENLDSGSYSIDIHSYTNDTGVFGFVYEGVSGTDNPLPNVNVYIFNNTWSDTSVTDSSGFYEFKNLTNTTYTLNFKKDRYKEVLYQYVTPANLSMTYKVIYMQKSTGDYYSRHYCTFTLKSIWGTRYSDVDATVYEDGELFASGTTGYDGSVVFHLFEDVEYRITFINSTQSIMREITLYPRDNEYTIYITGFDFSLNTTKMHDTVNWWYLKGDLNLTHAWLNFSYKDTQNRTTFIEYWINDTDNNILFYTNQSCPCPAGAPYTSNNIVNASNHTYLVHFSATHPDYPELEHSAIQTISYYIGKLIDLGFSEQWQYTVTAICIIIFIGMFFGATNVGPGGVIICLTAWFMSFIQWLPSSTIGYMGLTLATLLSVGWAMRKAETVHT